MSWIIQRVGQHWGKLLWEEAELLHFPRQSFTKEKWIWCQWEEGQMCPTLMLSPTHQSLSHSQMHGRNPGTCFFSILAARVKPTLFLLNLGQRHFGKSKLSRLICKHTTVVDLLSQLSHSWMVVYGDQTWESIDQTLPPPLLSIWRYRN